MQTTKTDTNKCKAGSYVGIVVTQLQLHIAPRAKHLQAIMMLWLNMEASFHTDGSRRNEEGNQTMMWKGRFIRKSSHKF